MIVRGDPLFHTTRWSLISRAGADTATSREAMAALCQIYWQPVYAYIRGRGNSPEKSQDLTQEFFLQLLEKEFLPRANRDKGKFRSFLLRSVQNFLISNWHRETAQKRGGNQPILGLDFAAAEGLIRKRGVDQESPEIIYQRQWALSVLDRALSQLETEMADEGNNQRFQRLKDFLTGDTKDSYKEVAERLGMTEGAVRVAVHRIRQRFGSVLRGLVLDTVEDPQDVESELRYLQKTLTKS